MDTKTKNELVGRLWLWSQSISKTQHLLEMAFRTNIAKQDELRIQEHDDYANRLNEFSKQEFGHKEGKTLPSHRRESDELYPRPFPTWLECCAIHDAFAELAIVYFCQIFNSGRSQEGETAKNDENFRKEHLAKILAIVFPTIEEMANFESLKVSLLTVRDKVIGHSDGEAYNITHSSPVSIKKGPNISWRNIDFEFWYSSLEKFINATRNYSNCLKLSTNTDNSEQ